MKIAILLDPIKNLNPNSDSTLYIYNLLQKKSHHVQLFTQHNLKIQRNSHTKKSSVWANCFQLSQSYNPQKNEILDLNTFDAILLRQEPPLNVNYSTNVQILNTLHNPVLMNRPQTLLTYPEKFIPLQFPQYIPNTIVTRQFEDIQEFLHIHNKAVLKSIHGFGGNEVILVQKDIDTNKIREFLEQHKCIIAQEFLPNIKHGDKRVLLVNGKLFGTLRRIPQKGSILANMVQGASGQIDTLTTSETKIIEEMADWLKLNGILFAGVDLIDGKLIEVNITCPTGFKVYHELTQNNQLADIIDNEIRAL